MDFPQVQAQLNDLPQTFKRYDAPYTQWVDALTSALQIYTQAVDSLLAQLNFRNAAYSWNDAWGAITNVQRRSNESDVVYKARIQNTILAKHASPVAMLAWLSTIEMVTNALLTEAFPTVGYTITLPASLTTATITQILQNLNVVRPAGVPFNVLIQSGGTYLDTVNYMDAPRTTGAYFAGASAPYPLGLGAGQNNAVSLLPDLLFVDPTINPGEPAL